MNKTQVILEYFGINEKNQHRKYQYNVCRRCDSPIDKKLMGYSKLYIENVSGYNIGCIIPDRAICIDPENGVFGWNEI